MAFVFSFHFSPVVSMLSLKEHFSRSDRIDQNVPVPRYNICIVPQECKWFHFSNVPVIRGLT